MVILFFLLLALAAGAKSLFRTLVVSTTQKQWLQSPLPVNEGQQNA